MLKKLKFGITDWIVLTVLTIAAVLTWYKNQTGFSGKGDNKWNRDRRKGLILRLNVEFTLFILQIC